MNIAFATGSDSKLFLNLCILLDSFTAHHPGETLHVCDFGLSDAHVEFLTRTGHFRAAPEHLADEPHAWRRKAALHDYFRDADPAIDAVVWFDADMLILSPVVKRIREIARAMADDGEHVAVCTDSSGTSIQAFIEANQTPETDLSQFSALLDDRQADRGQPYLNTGFFILPSSQLAIDWADQVRQVTPYLLFEQNTFNALAAAPGINVRVLDPTVWNVHGDLLADASTDDEVFILHTTSQGAHHAQTQFKVPIGDKEISGDLKIFARPDLMKLQGDHLMRFLMSHQELVNTYDV